MFERWEGPVASIDANPTTVKVDWPNDTTRTVTAFFQPSEAHYQLETTSLSGSLTVQPLQPLEGYPVNTTVTLIAAANPGYRFSLWQGSLSGTTNPASLLMDGPKSVVAVFNPTAQTSSDPSSGGNIVLDPLQPSNGYPAGTLLSVRALPADGYRFDQWSGDLSGSQNPQAVAIDTPLTLTAHFVPKGPFPWWWIALGVLLVFPALILLRVVYVLATRRRA